MVLLVIFMAIRLFLIRRSAQVTFEGAENTGGEGLPRRRQPRFLGVPSEVIATFPAFKFESASYIKQETQSQGDGEARITTAVQPDSGPDDSSVQGGGHQRIASASRPDDQGQADEKEAPQCSVCIGDFEEGDILRRLPCLHVFHQSCIDPWMTQHSTCPNCRWVLFEPPPPPPITDEEGEGSDRRWAVLRSGGSRVAPLPLPAAAAQNEGAGENSGRQDGRQPPVASFNVMAPAPFIGREVTHQSLRSAATVPPVNQS